ncbi:hypothetical protein FJT64_025110 [Amphibalanus amphitrite]|uniref:C2H2-type domain-containing protein n=1 Tax=Amphibalanus amphitrite TaxID=1232801 RepID=A0A6A4WKU8_AMPAM|nr:hypothetical protein FJT64_025110 [Amphibalanus amphitrite]
MGDGQVDRRLRCVLCGIDSFPSFSYFHTHHLYHHVLTRPSPVVVLEPLASAPPAGLRLTLRRNSSEPAAQFQVVHPSSADLDGVAAGAPEEWSAWQHAAADLWTDALSGDNDDDDDDEPWPKPKRSRKRSARLGMVNHLFNLLIISLSLSPLLPSPSTSPAAPGSERPPAPQPGSPMLGRPPAQATADGRWAPPPTSAAAGTQPEGGGAPTSVIRRNGAAGAVPSVSPGQPEGGSVRSPSTLLPHLIPIEASRPPAAAMVTPLAAHPAAVSPEAPRPASFGPKPPAAGTGQPLPPAAGTSAVCQQCGVPLPDAAAAQQHAAVYHGRPLPCRICSFWPTTAAELQHHLNTVHGGGQWQAPRPRQPQPASALRAPMAPPAKRPRMVAPQGVGQYTAVGAGRGVSPTAAGPAGVGRGQFAVPSPPGSFLCRYCRRQYTSAAARNQHEATAHVSQGHKLPPPPPPGPQPRPRHPSPVRPPLNQRRRGGGAAGARPGAPAQLVVPVFDLSVANAARLDALGVCGFLPVSKLGENRGQLGLPVVSVQGITKMGPSPRPVAFFHLGEAFSLRQ